MEAEATQQERRRPRKRMGVRLPISLEWTPRQGVIRRTRGMTFDFSPLGVYCHVEEPIPQGQRVEFDVVFPAELTATAPLAIHCRGIALRTKIEGRLFGVAASIESRDTRDLGDLGLDPERRVRRRIKPEHAASVEFPGLQAEIRDFSETGAFIADERPLPIGRQLDVRFRIDESGPPIEVRAVVRRVEPQVGMAVEFISLSLEAATRLRQMVRQNDALPALNIRGELSQTLI